MANELAIGGPDVANLTRYESRILDVRDMEHFKRAPLVPRAMVSAVAGELRRAMISANMEQAARSAELLLGSYPRHNIEEPAIYTRAMVSLLLDYPPAVGVRAIDLLTRECKFVPTRAELAEKLEVVMRKLRWAQFIIDRTLDEHERRKAELERERKAADDRAAFLARHNGKSPLDVLIEKGLYSKVTEDGEEKGSEVARGRAADGDGSGSRAGRRAIRGEGEAEGRNPMQPGRPEIDA